jgi:hypothetical protein
MCCSTVFYLSNEREDYVKQRFGFERPKFTTNPTHYLPLYNPAKYNTHMIGQTALSLSKIIILNYVNI